MTERALQGRTALVTGASGAIGKASAVRLARMGATVIVHGRDEYRTEGAARAVRAEGATAHVAIGELGDAKGVAAVVDAVRTKAAAIDVLVNNAGGESSQGGLGPWFEVSAEEWLATYESNLGSMVRLTQAFAPRMRERGWGRIILLSSGVVQAPMAIIPDYQGAKAAVRNMARTLSKALAQTGVTANSVSPGFVLTDTNRVWVTQMAAKAGVATEDWAAIEAWAIKKLAPNATGKLGQPDDIAAVVAFLASFEARYVNGVDIQVDGG